MIVEEAQWPTPESSQRGRDRSTKPISAPTVTAQLSRLTKEFTDSVHNGTLFTFDDTAAEDSSTESNRIHTPMEASSISIHTPAGFPREAPEPVTYSLFCVFDGHNGHEAAEYFMGTFQKILHSRLPPVHFMPKKVRSERLRSGTRSSLGFETAKELTCAMQYAQPPLSAHVCSTPFLLQGTTEASIFQREIRSAMARSIAVAERNFAAAGVLSGSTVTLALIVDSILCLANLGDSTAFIDNGSEGPERLSEDHNLDLNAAETERLRKAGIQVARLSINLEGPAKPGDQGIGPLRCWPAGLCLTRTFGDFDAPTEIMSTAYVRTLTLPERGCRLVLASDGLWSVVSGPESAASLTKTRRMSPQKAAQHLLMKSRVRRH